MGTLSGIIGSKQNKILRDYESLKAQLAKQVRFLQNSSAIFDSGQEDEAIRIALTLRVLLHDKGSSQSLLSHLEIKSKILFTDSAIYRDKYDKAENDYIEKIFPGMRSASYSPTDIGLVVPYPNPDGTYGWRAPLSETRYHPNDFRFAAQVAPQSFFEWWTKPLLETSNSKKFSRENLVLIMANQDGGAHVDAALDKDYIDLCEDSLGMQIEWNQQGVNSENYCAPENTPAHVRNNVAFASVRQIAFEVILTLQRADLVSE